MGIAFIILLLFGGGLYAWAIISTCLASVRRDEAFQEYKEEHAKYMQARAENLAARRKAWGLPEKHERFVRNP